MRILLPDVFFVVSSGLILPKLSLFILSRNLTLLLHPLRRGLFVDKNDLILSGLDGAEEFGVELLEDEVLGISGKTLSLDPFLEMDFLIPEYLFWLAYMLSTPLVHAR